MSNVVDTDTSTVPASLHEHFILDRAGVRIGFIGLIEEYATLLIGIDYAPLTSALNRDWISTVPAWPSNFKYKDIKEVGLELSKRLRDPAGEHRCDLIIALTHARCDFH